MYQAEEIKTKHVSGSAYKWYTCSIINTDSVHFLMMVSDDNHERIKSVVQKTIKILNTND